MQLALLFFMAGISVATVNGKSHILSKRGKDATNILEVVVFVDQKMVDFAAKKLPNKRSGDNKQLIKTIVKGMFNNVRALWRNPTLKYKFDVQVLQIVFLEKNSFNDARGSNDKFQKNFCKYTKNLPRDGIKYPKNWDVAVLLTGVDIYDAANNNDYFISGYASVGGGCDYEVGCAIVEGRISLKGDSFVMAHEIGHLLGMNHDGEEDNTDCTENSYIMSGSPDYNRNGDWSSCSYGNLKQYMKSDNANCYGNNPLTSSWANKVVAVDTLPGLLFSAEEQCIYEKGPGYKVYNGMIYRDNDSFQADLCSELFCQGPNSDSQDPIGAALDGTPCGNKKNQGCFNNKCVPLDRIPSNRFIGSQKS